MCIDEFNGDNFDHGPHGFVGGGYMARCRPTAGRSKRTRSGGNSEVGRQVEEGGARQLLSSLKGGSIHGSFYSYRDIYLDLDPTYHDRFGRPLVRMTIDFHDNELKRPHS